jgi:leucine-rich repeat protein SHOC2
LFLEGKVLVETSTLKQSDVGSGAKLMLMASQGLHQGEGPILKEASIRPISRTVVSDKVDQRKPSVLVDKNRTDRWKATGVIALAQANLKVYREGLCVFIISLGVKHKDKPLLPSHNCLFVSS